MCTPDVIRLYEENNLNRYIKDLDAIEEPDRKTGLANDEEILMKVLMKCHPVKWVIRYSL